MVALLVTGDFIFPKIRICFGDSEGLAPLMSMPEATIDEYTGSVFPHHDIGMSGQSVMIEPVSEPFCEEVFSHNELRFGILGMNRRHIVVASLFFKRSHAGKVKSCDQMPSP